MVGFITVGLNYIAPDTVFLFLVNPSGAIALFVWVVIASSQLILRRRMGADAKDLALKMWLFPYLTWVAIVSIVALLIGMVVLESTRESLLLSLALAVVVVGIGIWRYRKDGAGHAGTEQAGTEQAGTEQAGTEQTAGTSTDRTDTPAEEKAGVGAGPAS